VQQLVSSTFIMAEAILRPLSLSHHSKKRYDRGRSAIGLIRVHSRKFTADFFDPCSPRKSAVGVLSIPLVHKVELPFPNIAAEFLLPCSSPLIQIGMRVAPE
jgi:hypothetical protein